MLELVTVSCGYGAFNAAADLSLVLRPGTITALLGANGAGKSSTLMCVAGHVDLQAGSILFGGEDISRLPATERVRRGIAISPEGRRLFKDLSVALFTLPAPTQKTAHAYWSFSPGWANASLRWLATCRVANSKCWPLVAH